MKTINFQLNNHDARYLKIIYCSIDINNIEKYLKRVGELEITKNIKISFIPNKYIYSINHLCFASYITEHKFIDNINVSNNFSTEILLTISYSDQIKNISNELYLKEEKNKYVFMLILSKKKIEKKEIEKIKNELNIKEKSEKEIKFNTTDALLYYKVKSPNAEDKIIEKMGLSTINK